MLYSCTNVFPKSFLSFVVGLLVDVRFPGWLLLPAIKLYCAFYRVNLEESKHPVGSFKTFNEFFTRELKSGIRPLGDTPVVHPCDALLVEAGDAKQGSVLLNVKMQEITLKQLLGPMVNDKPEVLGGDFFYALYYLSPRDYHRVHFPVDGKVVRSCHIPGELWPVNNWALKNVEQLFFKNERVVTEIQLADGSLAYAVLVGALNVGRMTVAYDKKICTNKSRWDSVNVVKYKDDLKAQRGQELGRFNMGSSVVLVVPTKLANQSGFKSVSNPETVFVNAKP